MQIYFHSRLCSYLPRVPILVEGTVHAVFLKCEKSKILPLSCRKAVITLLPKKGDLGFLKNCRPISLLGIDYKILSKTLTNRLKKVMASIIEEDIYILHSKTFHL